MITNPSDCPRASKIFFLLVITLLIGACSTGEMEFSVSELALKEGSGQDQSTESQNSGPDESAEENAPQQNVIPEKPVQETTQPIPEKKENAADAELDCSKETPPNISYWPYRSPYGEAQNLLMVDARLGAHFDFDRFVLEFESNPSGSIAGPPDSYSVQWVSQPPIQFGSGQSIEVQGSEYLEILLHAYAYSRGSIPSEYSGLTEIQATGMLNVTEAVFGGEVEGKLVWAIGAKNRAGFRVLEIPDPPRLVIDICTSVSG
ncbi:MAG: hypothetical protein CL522_01955 [Actinobacteria bacterium]|nr:hypothetical protein [Actinomycetota bacterium]